MIIDSSLIKKFLNFLEINGSSKNTIASYKKDLYQFIDYIFLHKNLNPENFNDFSFLNSLNQDDFDFFTKKLYENGISNSSLARKISCLRSFFKFIFYEKRLIEKLPQINFQLPKLERKLPKILSKNEMNQLISFCESESMNLEKKNFLTWLLMFSLLEFLYSTGCRISEALSIRIGQIINHKGEISEEILISGKGGSERMIFINHSASDAISKFIHLRFKKEFSSFSSNFQILRNSSEFLFSLKEGDQKPISRQRVFQLLKEAGLNCGLDFEKLSPHKIRHSIAIHLLNGNNDSENDSSKDHEEITADIRLIQEFLGHKSINTTQIYLDYQNYQNLKNVVENKHPLNKINLFDKDKNFSH